MKEKYRRAIKYNLIWFIITILATIIYASNCSAQIYYGDLTKEEYNKIVSGNSFYPAKVLLYDGTVLEGFVARFPESNVIRYKETTDAKKVFTLTERHVKTFKYGLEEYSYPTFIFIDLDARDKKTVIRAVEIVSQGEITIYVYTWVELPDVSWLPSSNRYYTLNVQFYLEKDDKLIRVDDFSKDLRYLIEDKEEVFKEYKGNYRKKYRNTKDYKEFINLINLYNETE